MWCSWFHAREVEIQEMQYIQEIDLKGMDDWL